MSNLLNDPVLNEFVYTLLFESSLSEKRKLKGKYFKISMNAKAAKTFATTSSREEKEYVMAQLGVEFFYFIAKRGTTLLKLKEILDKFEKNKKVAALSDIAEERIFVTSDKEVIRLMGLMAQSIHHHSHYLNLELLRQGFHIQKWPKHYANSKDLQTREVDASAKALAKTCLNAGLTIDYWPGNTGYTPLMMKILLYLYTVSHLYVTREKLRGVFIGYTDSYKFANAIRELDSEQLVIRHYKDGENEYTITGAGIHQVNEYINRVINLNTF